MAGEAELAFLVIRLGYFVSAFLHVEYPRMAVLAL